MFPVLALQRHRYKIGSIAIILLIFRHRVFLALTLGYTFFQFIFTPAPVLGDGDGWDLVNLVAPQGVPEIVPRIIHQVRLGDLVMEDTWVAANKTCADLHLDSAWRFELWDNDRANAFVAEQYPDLLKTYLGYGQEIQRSNVLRYLILYKIGGIYLDLDIACKVPLDFFTTVDWVSLPGSTTGINGAFMTAAPHHPFLKHTVDHIKRYNTDWISPYVTNMFTTGCYYVSTMHATYAHRSVLRVLPKAYELGGLSQTHIFHHLDDAASWHRTAIKTIINHFRWLPFPWKIAFIFQLFVGLVACRNRRNARKAAASRAMDTELFDLPDGSKSLRSG